MYFEGENYEKEDLIAPQTYNIVSEIKKYAENPAKEAILFENEREKRKQLLMQI